MKPGKRVRMTEEIKRLLRSSGSGEHVREFGNCVGIVIGPADYNNVKPSDPKWDPNKVGPEVAVRWEPSKLRYHYHPKHLRPA